MTEQKATPQSLLLHIAQEDIPEREIDLWPGLQKNLLSSKPDRPSRGSSMITQRISKRFLSITASLAVILLLGFLLFTPSGQALAQDVLRFFTRQPSDVLPSVNLALTPTRPIHLVNVAKQTAMPSVEPTQPGCDSILSAHCTIEQVQSLIAFKIKQLAKLPKGMSFTGAVVQGQQVVLVYNCPSGCFLMVYEEPVRGETTRAWVGASAQIKTVQIQMEHGPVQGEYVQGGYTGKQGDLNATWDSSQRTYRLRWEEDAVLYTIQWSFPTPDLVGMEPNAELLAALAESLAVNPTLALDPNHLLNSADAALAAGFAVRVPAFTPKGWDLAFYTYDASRESVCIDYASGGMVDHPRLFVRESVRASFTALEPGPVAPGEATNAPVQYDSVTVGGADDTQGRMARGHLTTPADTCGGQNDIQMTNEALQWTSQGMTYEIYAMEDPLSPETVSRLDLVRMAESLTGVTTIPAETLDPEHLWTIADAEKLAGFKVNAPAQLPEKYVFVMARIENSAVISTYQQPDSGLFTPDLTAAPPIIYLYQCPARNDGQDFCTQRIRDIPDNVRETVQIEGQSGFFAKGDWMGDETSNWKRVWHTDDMFLTRRLYWKNGSTVYLMELMWGGLIDRKMMIQMAGSLQ